MKENKTIVISMNNTGEVKLVKPNGSQEDLIPASQGVPGPPKTPRDPHASIAIFNKGASPTDPPSVTIELYN